MFLRKLVEKSIYRSEINRYKFVLSSISESYNYFISKDAEYIKPDPWDILLSQYEKGVGRELYKQASNLFIERLFCFLFLEYKIRSYK